MNNKSWIESCQKWKNKWPVPQEQGDKLNGDSNGINLYKFYEVLNQNLKEDSVICWDAGSVLYCSNQSLRLNGKNQRSIGSLAQAEMGCALALSAGVSFAKNKGEVICCIGDGSFNTNPQALSIIRYHSLPVKIFVLNNGGYLSIKNSQDKFYNGRRIGTDNKDGIFFPQIEKIARAYEIRYSKISKIDTNYADSLIVGIPYVFSRNEPFICEVICQELQEISPGVTAQKMPDGKLEQCDFANIAPFIKELEEEMLK